MFGEKSFFGVPKTSEQLGTQLDEIQKMLGSKPELLLVPPSVDRANLLKMSMAELQEKYARRYHAYIELLRHKKDNDFVSREALIFGFKKWLVALNSLDQYILNHEAGTDVTLRGKQIDVFHAIREFLESGGQAGYIKLPTGYGKTVLFTEMLEALDLKTLIVVPTNLLVKQTIEKIEKFAKDMSVGRVDKVAKEYGKQVTVTTYASLPRQIESGNIDPKEYELLILDESHESTSGARVEAGEVFVNAVKFGFSATPKLSPLLPREIYSMPLREAIEDGGLCSVSVITAMTSIDLSNVKVSELGDYSENELEAVVNVVGRNQAAVELYKQGFGGQLAVAYCVGVVHAHMLAETFKKAGVPAAAISGKTSHDEQEALFTAFHRGEIKVLCNADILIAGFDEPRARVCLNLRPTKSPVIAEQRGGRVLRLDEDNPKKHATVVEFVDKGWEISRPILFSKILEGAFVDQSGAVRGGSASDGAEVNAGLQLIDIPGLKVFFDADEVMRVTNSNFELIEKKNEKLNNLSTLKFAVQAVGVVSQSDYDLKRKQHLDWPPKPQTLSGWISWYDFLGKETPVKADLISDLATLKAAVLAAGITTRFDYEKKYKQYLGWPSTPRNLVGWISWNDFFGKNVSILISDFTKLKKNVQSLGVSSRNDYKKICKQYPNWPSKAEELEGWTNWYDFLGKDEPLKADLISDLAILKIAARDAGVVSSSDYLKKRRQYPNWPSKAEELEGWTNWYDFLGKDEPLKADLISDLAILKIAARDAGVMSGRDYTIKSKQFLNWPSRPDDLEGWTNWYDFLGKNKK